MEKVGCPYGVHNHTAAIYTTMVVSAKRDEFLRNKHNKEQLIRFLCAKLNKNDIANSISEGDADTLIVQTAFKYAKMSKKVIVSSDDTDILALLIHHRNASNAGTIFFSTERKVSTSNKDTKKKEEGREKCRNGYEKRSHYVVGYRHYNSEGKVE